MNIEEAYRQKKAAQLKEWGAAIDLFEARAENAGADARIRHALELEALRVRHCTASQTLQDLETASGEAWQEVKKSADQIWKDLREGLSAAQAKFHR